MTPCTPLKIGLADGRVGVAGVISTKGLRKLFFLSGPPSDAFGLQNRERERVGAGPGADGDSVEALA
jgi:hypothetical protein